MNIQAPKQLGKTMTAFAAGLLMLSTITACAPQTAQTPTEKAPTQPAPELTESPPQSAQRQPAIAVLRMWQRQQAHLKPAAMLFGATSGDEMCLRDLIDEMGDRTFGSTLLICALPEALPLPVAGISIIALPIP